MKKIIFSTLLTALTLGAVAPTVLAEEATTKGAIEFKAKSGNDIILPETEPPVVVSPPTGSGTGEVVPGLNMTVPPLDFGIQDAEMLDKEYYALTNEYKDTAAQASPSSYYLPAMAIVRDGRGLAEGTGDWDLQVKATEFKSTESSATLTGATLTFNSPQVFNSMKTVPGQTVTSNEDEITFSEKVSLNDGPQSILSSKNGAGAGQTTYMLDSERQYNVDKPGEVGQSVTDLAKDTAIQGANLFVPGKVNKVVGETYQSTLTWTLSTTPDL